MKNEQYKQHFMSEIKDKHIIIYGAHLIARDLYQYLKVHNLDGQLAGFAVSQQTGNPKQIEDMPVKNIRQYNLQQENAIALIATPEKFFQEIENLLQELGYDKILKVGNQGLAALENEDVLSYMKEKYPEFQAKQDEKECLCLKLMVQNHIMKFMPLAAYPLDEKSRDLLDEIYYNRIKLDLNHAGLQEELYAKGTQITETKELKVYVASSPKDLNNMGNKEVRSWEIPIVGGAELMKGGAEEFHTDNVGEHISGKNPSYAETTVTYWVWKNSHADYKGISHYRRRYDINERDIAGILGGEYEAIVTIPRLVLPSVRQWFSKVSSLDLDDIAYVEELVGRCYPEYKEDVSEFLDGNILYPNNMVIARSDIYHKYCTWLFSILETMEQEVKFTNTGNKQRYAAYTAELLTSLYFMRNSNAIKIKEIEYQLFITGGL